MFSEINSRRCALRKKKRSEDIREGLQPSFHTTEINGGNRTRVPRRVLKCDLQGKAILEDQVKDGLAK
jgi:hypothetical protein